ncbi:MAG TPA: hypothetical protein VFB74_05200 [Kribbellaceae bacterium]|nr:hypothetical protein [Kribbellaceae bacterium]
MTKRRWLGLALLVALLVAGCANRDGLRVEGTAAPPTPKSVSSYESPKPVTTKPTVDTRIAPPEQTGQRSVKLTPAQLRQVLLASPNVDPDAKSVLKTCPQRCLTPGPAFDVVGNGAAQRVVTVRVLSTDSGFVAYLVGDVEGSPLVLSTIRGQDMRITAGKGRTLVVESKVYGPTDKTCCPSGSKVEIYRWNGHYLVRTSEVFTKGS